MGKTEMVEILRQLREEFWREAWARVVCVDYAMTIPNPSTRMKAVDWR